MKQVYRLMTTLETYEQTVSPMTANYFTEIYYQYIIPKQTPQE